MMHAVYLWDRWSALSECVRQGRPPDLGRRQRSPQQTEAFIAAMHANAAERAPALVRAVGAAQVRRMLDVGGGSGAYAIAFAKANPELQAVVLDRAEVLPIARRHIRAAGLSNRIRTQAGDLRRDELGEGFDLVLLSAICHMLSPEQNQDLLRRCWRALVSGGRVVIRDFVLDRSKTRPPRAALFSLNMLVNTDGGASYSREEYREWLKAAGFRGIRHIALADPGSGLMLGTREGR
jgi:predicted O-methyltransferase YrrM